MPSKQKAQIRQAVLTKIFPLILLVPLFLITSVFTKEEAITFFQPIGIPDLTPSTIFYTGILAYTGIMFVIETIYALPDVNKSNAGVFGAVLLGGIAIGIFVFAGAIFTGVYDPATDETEFNVLLSILMLMAIGMFIAQAREEIFHYRRFSMHRVFN